MLADGSVVRASADENPDLYEEGHIPGAVNVDVPAAEDGDRDEATEDGEEAEDRGDGPQLHPRSRRDPQHRPRPAAAAAVAARQPPVAPLARVARAVPGGRPRRTRRPHNSAFKRTLSGATFSPFTAETARSAPLNLAVGPSTFTELPNSDALRCSKRGYKSGLY